jgi:hypothetical protein
LDLDSLGDLAVPAAGGHLDVVEGSAGGSHKGESEHLGESHDLGPQREKEVPIFLLFACARRATNPCRVIYPNERIV